MKHFRFGLFVPGDSSLHRLDPRVKIVSVVVLGVLSFRASAGAATLVTLLLLVLTGLSGLRPRHILDALKPLMVFAALLFLIHLFFTDGEALVSLSAGPFRITREGLRQGGFVVWQFFALVSMGVLLTMTTGPSDLVAALENILSPLKVLRVPTQDLAIMVSLALRFLPTFLEEMEKLKTARLARGADWRRGGSVHRVKTAASLLVPLLLGAARRADDLAEAMEARGYARGPRTGLRELRMARPDYAALVILTVFSGMVLVAGLL
ncbi:MAG: energy-coupling factor transporter transmembrane protein EcfT [Syntrophaceae bacterium]|nr:energy-coupling factor transporter transmembrane protein EcfT [Syntrophaceae bacterium]